MRSASAWWRKRRRRRHEAEGQNGRSTMNKPQNVLHVRSWAEFRTWLASHPEETECWVQVKRGRPVDPDTFYYLDAVEEIVDL